jgi:hypothetical protein
MKIIVTHRFHAFPRLIYTKDGELWQEAYESYGRDYPARQLKEKVHAGKIKFLIDRKWVTKKKLNSSAYKVREVYETGQLPDDYKPFKS